MCEKTNVISRITTDCVHSATFEERAFDCEINDVGAASNADFVDGIRSRIIKSILIRDGKRYTERERGKKKVND